MESYSLTQKQSLPMEVKVEMSLRRIREFMDRYDTYVSYSGGKDSTVLLHLVRQVNNDIPAVFIDTGLEYPECREFVNKTENVEIIKPDIPFHEVIKIYGYPVISKEQSQYIDEYRRTNSEKLRDIRLNGNKYSRGKISEKWKYLLDAPFLISDRCCYVMKKKPAHKYEKKSGRKPFIGTLAYESSLRTMQYLKHGCNFYSNKRPVSMPLSFWLEEDIWEYIRARNLPYSKIYDMGYKRTGCMFCCFGIHLHEIDRFALMKETHPKIYNYCMKDLGIGKVLEYVSDPKNKEAYAAKNERTLFSEGVIL